MRKFQLLLLLTFAGCSSDGNDLGQPTPDATAPHVPQIAGLILSPDTARYMEGGGSMTVTARFDYADNGLDIMSMLVEVSDGTSLTLDFPDGINAESGTYARQFDMSTADIGACTVDIWLVDKQGSRSNHVTAQFDVIEYVVVDSWTNRLSGLPFMLNDILWDGDNFVAVGDSGTILTSFDGIDWAEQRAGMTSDLNAIASDGSEIVAVGDNASILLSSDHGRTWSVKYSGYDVDLRAVTVNMPQVVTGGMDPFTGHAFIMTSPDRGETWKFVQSLPQSSHFVTDLLYANGLYVAGTDVFSWESDARVMISVDGEVWQDVILRDDVAAIYSIVHDGQRFIAAGSDNTVFASADGFLWTQLTTPTQDIDFVSAAWNGSQLVAAGGMPWWYWWMGAPAFERDVGISSSNRGVTWQTFNIDGFYQSRGMAWGNGRFVSVGQSSPLSGEGAIYTSK